ncbi:Predicted arabinose efflux permease, MFS family [Chitinophaga sp. YR627]|uniref:MFS transporter n=1 Tax=Chitinophaga sp. YR627 TaxID=1881041 RepID=UPI0008E8240F|nr:MFS transporter [Chitinophaga sp. YR627]SFO75270.1 Predicted arabinose efflux permease, MFS family [Chitinophaga sp. YR627]
MQPTPSFSRYQRFVILVLALTQFTVVLDFMVISPLGDILMKSLSLQPQAFGFAVSAYAFSAGISGLLTAGFADRFDRKKLLLFFYIGFVTGTVLCGFAHSYALLVAARIVTGLFGGVIASVSMAIITDLFTLRQRGRVMGYVQMGFGASQVLGIPIGLFLANALGWEAAFWMIAGLGMIVAALIALRFRPVTAHLAVQQHKPALTHLWHTLTKGPYRLGFAATALLSIGGFMMMPFGSTFAVNNLGLTDKQLPLLFMVSGVSSLFIMPLVGRLSDRVDKFRIFTIASILMGITSVWYTNLGVTPLLPVIGLNVVMMMGIMGRMVPSAALTSAIPALEDRGAFMSVNTSLQQIAGGVAAAIAGFIVTQPAKGLPLDHYSTLGYVTLGISLLSIWLMVGVDRLVKRKPVVTAAVDEAVILSEGY